jgi:type II secretory pathway pseudopilin PulG
VGKQRHAIRHRARSEDGTTLAELLVGMTLLAVVATIATTGIVGGFRAQLDATNVASTLDSTRIATQRIRDFVRGADEVCASSTATNLDLWTDDNGDGLVVDSELDIFELVTDEAGEAVFQRRIPIAGSDEIQLIGDDIINAAVFAYPGAEPSAQPFGLTCRNGGIVAGGPSRTRSVRVTFEVENPQAGEPNLATSTTIQIRNAGLSTFEGAPPTPLVTFECPAGTVSCTFDAGGSFDVDGDAITTYVWDFGLDDVDTGLLPTASHTFSSGDTDYEVTLTVTDATGQSASVTVVVRPGLTFGNARPTAAFTVSCVAVICTFDGSASDDDSGIESYEWEFGDGTSPVTENDAGITHTFPQNGDYVVTLTVTDDDLLSPLSDSHSAAITASSSTMLVAQMDAVGGAVGASNKWEAHVTIQLGLTTVGAPGAGVIISATAYTSSSTDVSCSTDASGACQVVVSGIGHNKTLTFTVTQVNDPSGTYQYDESQNSVTVVTVGPDTP